MSDKAVLIGAGGHSKVIIDILKLNNVEIYGLTDNGIEADKEVDGYKIVGSDEILVDIFNAGVKKAVICVGSIGDNTLRGELFKKVKCLGFDFINAIHPSCVVSKRAVMGKGIAVMAGSIVNPFAAIGDNTVLNTGCIVEHDVIIEDNVFIAPGVVIGGGVTIGNNSFIGLGARIVQGVRIGKNTLIGAGTVVIKDVPDNAVVVGVPGRVKSFRIVGI